MIFYGAIMQYKNTSFVVVSVKKEVTDSGIRTDRLINTFQDLFRNKPVVLMARDTDGKAVFRSRRPELIEFLAGPPTPTIPWKKFNLKENQAAA